MLSWKDIDAERAQLGLSRAEFCRRAGISESTVTKGLQRGARVSNAVQAAAQRVLDKARSQSRREVRP